MNTQKPTTVGILSDTHGLLRPEIATVLGGCDHILHAGDIGDKQVLTGLQRIAPVTAVRGNMDYGSWSNHLPVSEMVEISGVFFFIVHDLYHLDLDPAAADIQVVVSGHTHRPELITKDGVIYINPGSAGHRRSNYPISMATIGINDGRIAPHLLTIEA